MSPFEQAPKTTDTARPATGSEHEALVNFLNGQAAYERRHSENTRASFFQQAAGIVASASAPAITVRIRSFPESNGKTNWTAMLVRKTPWKGLVGHAGGIPIDRGECINRIAYNAECARFLIGERDTEPQLMEYGEDIRTPEEWTGNDPQGLLAAMKATSK